MRILGISAYFHDAAAALIEDGVLIAAAEEERFTRIKHDPEFPYKAIDFCLAKAGIEASDIDYVVFYEKPFVKFERIIKTASANFPKSYWAFTQAMRTWLFDKLWVRSHIQSYLKVPKDKILFSDHHMSHAASSYYCSPFDDAAILTFDGVGEWATATVGVGEANNITITDELRFPHSVGLLYSAFTAFLGFEVNEGEYKVMGMAPYGEPKYVDEVQQMVQVNGDGSIWLDPRYFAYTHSSKDSYTKNFVKVMGPARDPDSAFFTSQTGFPEYGEAKPSNYAEASSLNQRYADIAASIQHVTEEILLKAVNTVVAKTGKTKLCMAGGVALNSVANGKILRETAVEELYIQPAAGDGGGAVGAAMQAWHSGLGDGKRFVMDHAYWGEEYSNDEIGEAITSLGFPSTKLPDESDASTAAVERIVDGKVIGWFQGRFEWGPRALGNRSIIADPSKASMKDIVNTKIKFREPFRPFAPSVIASEAPNYFDFDGMDADLTARFMLIIAPLKDDVRDKLPAVDHMGTARPQFVHQDTNPKYFDIISKMKDATGLPVILNTSFNVRGEPIVSSPRDALNTFANSGLDSLIMGDYVIDKE